MSEQWLDCLVHCQLTPKNAKIDRSECTVTAVCAECGAEYTFSYMLHSVDGKRIKYPIVIDEEEPQLTTDEYEEIVNFANNINLEETIVGALIIFPSETDYAIFQVVQENPLVFKRINYGYGDAPHERLRLTREQIIAEELDRRLWYVGC